MIHIELGEIGQHLASRARAATIRRCILASENSNFVIDCYGVMGMSHSFADELFSVLVNVEKDSKWFKEHIKLDNASNEVRQSILEAIHRRSKDDK